MSTDLMLIAGLVIGAIGLIVYSLWPQRREDEDAVRRRLSGRRGTEESNDISQQARERAGADLMKKATPLLQRIVMPTSDEEQTNLRLRLTSAGYRGPQAQTVFLGSKTVLGIVGMIIGAVVAVTMNMKMATGVGTACFAAGIGFMFPNLWLSMAISSRQQKLKHGLPDTLDLLVVSVESGLALDAALKRVGDEMAIVHPELSEEMRIATMEAQMGIPRSEALEHMARRADIEELRGLVSVITQAEKFGTSIARALRNQADTLRTKRRQAAEEKAQGTAVKLLFPLIFFIFPALGIVLGGPAALRMAEAFKNNPGLGG